MSVFKHLVTGKDNTTHDLGRWSWIGSFIAVVAGAAWNAMHGIEIHIRDLAEALGIVSGAHGAAIWAKKDTEPEKVDVEPTKTN